MSRKGENIYKRKDGRWEARYIHHYEDGKAKYCSLYGKSYAEVREKRTKELAKIEKMPVSAVKQRAEPEELCLLWLNERKTRVKESTYTRYARIVNKFILPAFSGRRLVMIRASDIYRFQEQMRETLSDKTVSDIMCVFKSVWHYGQELGYPCSAWKQPRLKIKPAGEIAVIPLEVQKQIKLALDGYPENVALGILFTLLTGVRIGELCGLRWGDIDLENCLVHIRRTVERIADLSPVSNRKTKVVITEPKTDHSIRTIPLPESLIAIIRSSRKSPESYLLTGSEKPTEPHTFYTRYKTFLRKNDLGNYTFHAIRHSFATRCVDCGFDIKSLSEILGHADVKTTMNLYVHPTMKMKKRQMDMLTL